jgi:phosphatidylglycerophosphatase C
MGDASDPRQGEPFYRPLVAFDFDGTLTVRDSFTAFLAWRFGLGRFVAGGMKLLPEVAGYPFRRDPGRLKAAAAAIFLRGVTRSEIETDARRFAEAEAPRLFRPDALRAWRRWQGRGARLLIVTATPDSVVAPFARGLGADRLIATALEFDEHDRATGRLQGKNCRGEEKVRRLRAEFGEDVRLEAAYGDTNADKPMLALADEQGFKVFQGTP